MQHKKVNLIITEPGALVAPT